MPFAALAADVEAQRRAAVHPGECVGVGPKHKRKKKKKKKKKRENQKSIRSEGNRLLCIECGVECGVECDVW